jgi:DNA-binding CsgD family transcriptional regulator
MLQMLSTAADRPHSGAGGADAAKPSSANPESWLEAMIDEIDFGMLLVANGQVVHANHMARVELASLHHPLRLEGRVLLARQPGDASALRHALTAAGKGQRRMITLGHHDRHVTAAIVPLPGADDAQWPAALVLLGKQRVCNKLSTHCFASLHNLTSAETQVLDSLCAGIRPADIARLQGVAISTVRTQIGSIRAKTGAGNITDIVRRVALLPPLVSALRAAQRGCLR